MHDSEHFMSLFHTKFLCVKAKFSLVKVGQTHRHLREDMYAYVRRFHDRALDSSDPVTEDVLFDVCLHG